MENFLQTERSLDIPLFNIKESQWEKLLGEVNQSLAKRIEFVEEQILPHLEIFSRKISANPHNLTELFRQLSGFTGTLWNRCSMHSKLDPAPAAGNDAKTLEILWNHSFNEVYTVTSGTPDEMFAKFDQQGISFDMISDAGGYFKGASNTAIGQTLHARYKRPVTFYNESNEQAEWDGKDEKSLNESTTPICERMTFLDQRHTTGADTKKKYNAVNIVTIGRNMMLRDLAQAVWRLRGLDKKQRVKFVLDDEVESILRKKFSKPQEEKITFEDILRFVILNQVERVESESFKGYREESDGVIQFLLLKGLIDPKWSIEEKKEAMAYLNNVWFKEMVKRPRELYGKILERENRDTVFQNEVDNYTKRIRDIFVALPFLAQKGEKPESYIERIQHIANQYKPFCAQEIPVPLRDIDGDQTVEIEEESRKETETELEVDEKKVDTKVVLGKLDPKYCKLSLERLHEISSAVFCYTQRQELSYYNALETLDSIPYFSLKLYCQHDPILKEYADAFEGVDLTSNVLEWPTRNPSIDDLQLLGNHRTPLHFVQIENGECILLSDIEAKEIKNSPSLYHLDYGFSNPDTVLDENTLETITRIKFLSGRSNFSKKECVFLKKWFQTHGVEKLQTLYHRHILSGMPEKAATYASSPLRDLFRSLT